MEDTVISLTPAAFQLAFMTWLACDNLRRYQQSGHAIGLILCLAIVAALPYTILRLRTAWRTRAFTSSGM